MFTYLSMREEALLQDYIAREQKGNEWLDNVVYDINEDSEIKVEDVDTLIYRLNETFNLEGLDFGCDTDNVLIRAEAWGHTFRFQSREAFDFLLYEVGIENIDTVKEIIYYGWDYEADEF